MLTRDILDRLTVVLVRARNPNNIGAAARAMHDFGFGRLRVVNEFAVPFEAARSAVDASAVLREAENCASVAEAVADCTVVVGTTAVGERELRHPLLALADAAPVILGELRRGAEGRVALLFGSEKTGLSNEELSFCNLLVTVPMYAHEGMRHASMNLGQAVAVCLYELVREVGAASGGLEAAALAGRDVAPGGRDFALGGRDVTRTGMGEPAPAGELDRVAAMLGEVLQAAGYDRRHPAHAGEDDVRRLVRKMGLDRMGTQVWMGILRQVLWKLRQRAASPESVGDRDR